MLVPKKYLKKFKYIDGPCTAVVQCLTNVDETLLRGKGDSRRYYVPLRVFKSEDIDEITDTINSYDGNKFEMEEIYDYILSGVIWESSISDTLNLPIKGEEVIATFEYDEDEELICTNIVPIAKVKLKKFNLEKFTYNKNYDMEDE